MQRLTTFKDKSFLACVKADWYTTVAKWLNGMKIIGGEVIHTPDGIIINPFMSYGAGSGDTTRQAFGIASIVGAVVTINAGEVQWGRSTFTAGPTNVTLTSDYQYIGVECDGATATVIGPDANVTAFRSDDTTFRTWLHQFRLVSGRAELNLIGHVGNILIPAVFSV